MLGLNVIIIVAAGLVGLILGYIEMEQDEISRKNRFVESRKNTIKAHDNFNYYAKKRRFR